MQKVSEHGSEVARLLGQISAEYQAAQRGMSDFAYGVSRHEFISARMEHMGRLHVELQAIVGESAMALIVDKLGQIH